jgi:hypothetical protein
VKGILAEKDQKNKGQKGESESEKPGGEKSLLGRPGHEKSVDGGGDNGRQRGRQAVSREEKKGQPGKVEKFKDVVDVEV